MSNKTTSSTDQSRNIPPLRFPEFKGEWEKKKLKEVSTYFNGGSFENDVKEEGKYELITLKSVDMSGNLAHSKRYLDIKVPTLSKNTLIMILSEQSPGLLGMTALIPTDNKYVLNQRVAEIRPNSNVESYFLSMAINRNQNYFSKHGAGTKVQNISKPNVENYSFLCPSLPEQTKIATFLTAVDEKIQALKKKHSLLEQYKKGAMQRIFSQELRFKDRNGNDFPEWEVKKGGDLFESITNKNHKSDLPILAITQEHGAIPRNLIDYQISVTDKSVESYKVVEVGDFIISLRSFQGGIEYSNYKGICSPAYTILRNTQAINKTFFKYYLKTDYYIQRLCEKLEGIRDGKMISYKYFSEIDLPYPSIQEQTLIANLLSALDEKINQTQRQIEKTELWKKGLLQKMFV